MKKIFVIIVLSVISISLLFGKVPIEFEELTHDFGEIAEEGGPYTTEFIFTNISAEDIEIERVKAG